MSYIEGTELSSDETPQQIEEGPIKIIDPDKVPKDPPPMLDGFEWVTMDLTQEKQVCQDTTCDK